MTDYEMDPFIVAFSRANVKNSFELQEKNEDAFHEGIDSDEPSAEQLQKRISLYRIFCKLLADKKKISSLPEFDSVFERGVLLGQRCMSSRFRSKTIRKQESCNSSEGRDDEHHDNQTDIAADESHRPTSIALPRVESGDFFTPTEASFTNYDSVSVEDNDLSCLMVEDLHYEKFVKENPHRNQPCTQRIKKFILFLFPGLRQLSLYFNRHFYKVLFGDVVAGISVAAISIPQCVSYGLLSGLPPIYGLYTSLIPMLAYCLLGTSRHISIAPIAVVALLNSAAIADLPTLEEKVQRTVLMTFQAGLFMLLLGILRMGFLVNFLFGFGSAIGVLVVVGQLKDILGVSIPNSQGLHFTLIDLAKALGETKWQSVLFGCICLFVLLVAKNFFIPLKWKGKKTRITLKKIPINLVLVILCTLVMYIVYVIGKPSINEDNPQLYGIKLVGSMPSGFPAPTLSMFTVSWSEFTTAFVFAVPMAFIGYVQTITVIKFFADKNGYEVDANQELIAGGISSITGSFFGSFYPSGSMSRASVGEASGASTQVHSLIVFFALALIVQFLTFLFYYLPKPLLAAVIIVAVYKMVDIWAFINCLRTKPVDGLSLAVSFLATLFIGMDVGVLIAAAVSLLLIVYRASRARVPVLGRMPGTNEFRSIKRWSKAIPYKGILTLRFDADLLFVNVNHLRDTVLRKIRKDKYHVQVLVLDCSTVSTVDTAGIAGLVNLFSTVESHNVRMLLAGMKNEVWKVCKRAKMDKKIPENRFFSQTDIAVFSAQELIAQKSAENHHKVNEDKVDEKITIERRATKIQENPKIDEINGIHNSNAGLDPDSAKDSNQINIKVE
eukprot:CAMPEP_0117449336 /NCGR_PEP_ID=MMETSP0759-20121206/7893_1 /TAXON_ID=63605 /ORGANISM="Percolomonas cosmopolitus, Strain WS" /LENGTH=836 /DNA_ID=CAMNT_0005241809 /DNA_START=203 /DNA_END=2714 /DNA_ORIENTATION=+